MHFATSLKIILAVQLALLAGGCALVPSPEGSDRVRVHGPAGTGPSPALTPHGMQRRGLYETLRAGFSLPDLGGAEVRRQENWYRKHPGALSQLVDPGSWYLPYIVQEVLERAMPTEIALLPAVESGFDARAKSPSGAAGLWQFTGPTARHFGLYQGPWLDQRMNLETSTRAALDYLEELNQSFDGDWLLALAAYNAGEGTIRKLMRDNRHRGMPTDFGRLRLAAETRRFVPKLIALRNIIAQPDRFGVMLPPIDNEIRFVRIDVPNQVHHARVAALCGIESDLVTQINAGQLQGATPPQGPHRIRLPRECEARLDVAKLGLVQSTTKTPAQSPTETGQAGDRYTVRAGDNLWRIARDNQVSLAALSHANPGVGTDLNPGDQIRIPESPNNVAPRREVIHRVNAGDTLSHLAQRYRVSMQSIAQWNRITLNTTLRLGQSLRIYLE
jgi:membrane-bound lytic murein transglycosylase D